MRRIFLFSFLIICAVVTAQKVDVIHRSDFRHDYVVGQFVYVEDAADTSSLKYIATLRIHQENYPYIISNFVERFKTEAKDLGANCFRVSSYEEKDSSVTLTVKTYFAYEKFFDLNEGKRNKDKIYILSSERNAKVEQYFYLDDSLRTFPSMQYVALQPADQELVKIMAFKSKSLLAKNSKPIKFKAGKESSFMVVGSHLPEANGFIKALVIVATAGTAGVAGAAIIPSSVRSQGIAKLPYSYGRMLLDIYKEAPH